MAELDSKNGIPERKAIINSISNSIGPMLR